MSRTKAVVESAPALQTQLATRLRCEMDEGPAPPRCPATPELRPQLLVFSRRTHEWRPSRRRTPTNPEAKDRAALGRAVGRDLTHTGHRQNARSAPALI